MTSDRTVKGQTGGELNATNVLSRQVLASSRWLWYCPPCRNSEW